MTLLGYELKKILLRPFTLAVLAACIALLLATQVIRQSNYTAYTWDSANQSIVKLKGTKALEYEKSFYETISGPWDEDRFAEILQQYHTILNNEANYTDELDEISMQNRAHALANEGMSEADIQAFDEANPIYNRRGEAEWNEWLLWNQFDGVFRYSWIDSAGRFATMEEIYPLVSQPAEFAYSAGMEELYRTQTSMLAILAIILVLAGIAPVFSEEAGRGTEPILLSTKHGRRKQIYVKLAASAIFTVGALVLLTLLALLINGILYGFDAINMPIQLNYQFIGVPLRLTFLQLALFILGLQAAGTLSFMAVVLLFSCLFSSTFQTVFMGIAWAMANILFCGGSYGVFSTLALFSPPALLTADLRQINWQAVWLPSLAMNLVIALALCWAVYLRYRRTRLAGLLTRPLQLR